MLAYSLTIPAIPTIPFIATLISCHSSSVLKLFSVFCFFQGRLHRSGNVVSERQWFLHCQGLGHHHGGHGRSDWTSNQVRLLDEENGRKKKDTAASGCASGLLNSRLSWYTPGVRVSSIFMGSSIVSNSTISSVTRSHVLMF